MESALEKQEKELKDTHVNCQYKKSKRRGLVRRLNTHSIYPLAQQIYHQCTHFIFFREGFKETVCVEHGFEQIFEEERVCRVLALRRESVCGAWALM